MRSASSFAPGRVELLGNHTDYNEGYVLSAAIHFGVTLNGQTNGEGVVRLTASSFGRSHEASLSELVPSEAESWANYPLGVIRVLQQEGFEIGGFEAEIGSDLPVGAGLSSSAALEVSTGRLVEKLFDLKIDPLQLAKFCRRAENEFVGVNCGLLDQASSVFGKQDHAIFLDCRKETVETVPFPSGMELLVAHSGVKHALVGGEYNERREQCFEAAEKLGAKALRDVNMAHLEASHAQLPEMALRRARHIVGENERVLRGIGYLRDGNAAAFGELMFESHESSRVNFENSTPELDTLVAIAREETGVLGSRLTGGGFGGATVSLVQSEHADAISRNFITKYLKESGHQTQIYRCRIADGAR